MTVAWAQILFLLPQRDYKIVNALKNCISSQIFGKDWCNLKDVWEVLHVILEEEVRNIIFFLLGGVRGENGKVALRGVQSTALSAPFPGLTHSMWLREHFSYLFLDISLWQEYPSYPNSPWREFTSSCTTQNHYFSFILPLASKGTLFATGA